MDDPVSWHNLATILQLNINTGLIISILLMVFLLLLSGLVAAAEVSFFSLEPQDFEKIKKDTGPAANKIMLLLSKQKQLIATIVLAHNFVNIGVVILSESVLDELLSDALSENTQFLIRVVLVTFLIVLTGEVIPKIYTKQNALKGAYLLVNPLKITDTIFSPLSFILVKFSSFFDRFIKQNEQVISVDDLSQALELTSNDTTPEEEKRILKGIVEFGNTEVKQIMRPRMEMLTLNEEMNFEEVFEKVKEFGFSRIPVYELNAENIKGIIYTKDLLPYLNKDKNFEWKALLRKPFFVPMNKKIDDLLKEFQQKKMHMAIAVDEYGAVQGLVTLEDIIEEILGEINDEFDDEELFYSKLDDKTFVFEAKIKLNDLYKVLDIDGELFEEKKGDADTLAGFILELTGKIPMKNEKIVFENYAFTIEAADKRRIKRIKLNIKATENEMPAVNEKSN